MQFLAPLICCVALFSSSAAFAAISPADEAPHLYLTLPKAIQMALENNLAIKVDAFGPEIAQARQTTTAGAFDPELRASFQQDTARLPDISEYRTSEFALGVGGLTPLGTTYQVGVSSSSFNDYSQHSFGASLGIVQPLLRGFGTDVNLAGLRIARINVQSSSWAFRQQVIDVVTRTSIVYNELYAAQRRYDAVRRSRDAALQLESDEKRRAEIGVRIALDVTTARAEAAAREETVLLAQLAIENNERYLKQLITSDTRTLLATRVSITPPPTPAVGPIDVQQGLLDALLERPDYQQALLELKVRKINIITAKNEALPRLDLTGSLNLLGVTRDEFQSSFNLDSASTPQSWSAGIIFRMPIPNRAARGRLQASQLINAQALVDLQSMEQAIIVDVANAAGQIDTAQKRIRTNREAYRLAEESLTAGANRLKAGGATSFEVLELQRKLTESEASLIKAEADYHNAISEYDRRTGTTLARNGIAIEAAAAISSESATLQTETPPAPSKKQLYRRKK